MQKLPEPPSVLDPSIIRLMLAVHRDMVYYDHLSAAIIIPVASSRMILASYITAL